jgi:hypothetical protein
VISKHIKDLLSNHISELEWTIETYTGRDHTGTVITNTPRNADFTDERDFLFPSYQVYLRSSDKALVEFISLKAHELLNKRKDEIAIREYRDERGNLLGTRSYNIVFIECDPPIRVGLEGKHLDYYIKGG